MNNLEELREHCEEMMAISPLRYAYIPASSIITLIDRIETAEAELSAANERLLVPVVLPICYAVRAGHPINESERNVMIPKDGGNWLSRFDVEHAIRVAGFKMEGARYD
ncbi:phage-like protein [Yersinia aldovae]|uniref:hypothetical protein n=1 Tax=Yersinia aldovae TaxID=29483 RepID=UPI0005E278A1|nr:hypothetical protein [Yersinia aldovae]CNJ17581.1 phage-like protein [Yersinia aldovae]